jgi:hypothetical protein
MEVLGDDDDEEEMLRVMAQQRQAGIAAAREAERTMEGVLPHKMAPLASVDPAMWHCAHSATLKLLLHMQQ